MVYEAPELFVREILLSGVLISDFMLADIWALGMILFWMINPSVKYPYRSEIRSVESISSQDEKYVAQHATVWRGLEEIFRRSANFDRHSQLSLREAANIISREDKRVSTDLDVLHLKVNHSSATVRPTTCSPTEGQCQRRTAS